MDLYEKQNTPLIALCPLNRTTTITVFFNDPVCWTVARKAFGISGGHPNGLRDPSDAHQIKQIKHPSTIKIWTIWVASNKGITEHGRICSAEENKSWLFKASFQHFILEFSPLYIPFLLPFLNMLFTVFVIRSNIKKGAEGALLDQQQPIMPLALNPKLQMCS